MQTGTHIPYTRDCPVPVPPLTLKASSSSSAPRLETGDYAGEPTLETHPRWVDDGLITGLFPPIVIQNGYHFRTRIGCRYHNVHVCNVEYQLNYYLDGDHGTFFPLQMWHESYDGSMREVDLDLSSLADHSVEFVFVVRANGTSEKDWDLWVAPRVVHP
ncbi:MAG: hypothetical protein JEZ06_13350 [Anaerolineaceae bacterium]|nr:hypothetical protein [Anaerolineaceae bacterium]